MSENTENKTVQEIVSLRMNTKQMNQFKVVKKRYSEITLENAKTLTSYVDSLLFKSRSLNEVFAMIQEAKEAKFKDSRDFKNLSILKKHVKYRINHDGFEVSLSKAGKLRLVKLNA
jgi:hypothetical protein